MGELASDFEYIDPSGYCLTAENLAEIAFTNNMSAQRLRNPFRHMPGHNQEAASAEAAKRERIAQVADAMVRGCTRCELSTIKPGKVGEECPIQGRLGELKYE